MGERPKYRVFVSAFSAELASYREEVARVLRRKGLEVEDQRHFRQGSATLLEQLRDYIEGCDAVVLLIGERAGAFPSTDHVAALGSISIFDRYRAASGQAAASYSQWEYFLAKHFGRKTYTFFTEAGFVPDQTNDEEPKSRAMQAAFRAWVDRSGESRDALRTNARLIEDVLVQRFADLRGPKPTNLPYSSLGPLFKGRDDFLDRLRKSLVSTGQRATALVGRAVHGLGGVGKTRTAVEYAWRHEEDYTALLFVGAETPSDLQRNIAGLCGPTVLNLAGQHAAEEAARVNAALSWLQDNSGWLLILDNIDSREAADSVSRLLVRLRGGHVLITARLSEWSPEITPLELDVLTSDAAGTFLLERTEVRRRKTADDAEQARRLAKELGYLALALEQAGAYIARKRLTFAAYLEEWRTKRDAALEWFDESVTHYPRSVATTWQTSVDELSESGQRLLEFVAWFAPEPIPESLLDVPVPDYQSLDLRQGLEELDAYCLVTRDAEKPQFYVHRLVQDVTRRRARKAEGETAGAAAILWIDDAFAGDPQEARSWQTLEPLAPHALAIVDGAGVNTQPLTTRLMGRLGLLFFVKALYRQAEPLFRKALAVDEAVHGPNHRSVATDLNNLAGLLSETDRMTEAEPLYRRALAINEAHLGASHPNVARGLNNLGNLLRATSRLDEAESFLRRALGIDEARELPNNPDVARDLNNLAALLRQRKESKESEALYRRALSIVEAIHGPDDPRVAICLNNLAVLLGSKPNKSVAIRIGC